VRVARALVGERERRKRKATTLSPLSELPGHGRGLRRGGEKREKREERGRENLHFLGRQRESRKKGKKGRGRMGRSISGHERDGKKKEKAGGRPRLFSLAEGEGSSIFSAAGRMKKGGREGRESPFALSS